MCRLTCPQATLRCNPTVAATVAVAAIRGHLVTCRAPPRAPPPLCPPVPEVLDLPSTPPPHSARPRTYTFRNQVPVRGPVSLALSICPCTPQSDEPRASMTQSVQGRSTAASQQLQVVRWVGRDWWLGTRCQLGIIKKRMLMLDEWRDSSPEEDGVRI